MSLIGSLKGLLMRSVKDEGVDFSIDILTAQELRDKGTLRFQDYGGVSNYFAVFEHRFYSLVRDKGNNHYELLNKEKYHRK